MAVPLRRGEPGAVTLRKKKIPTAIKLEGKRGKALLALPLKNIFFCGFPYLQIKTNETTPRGERGLLEELPEIKQGVPTIIKDQRIAEEGTVPDIEAGVETVW